MKIKMVRILQSISTALALIAFLMTLVMTLAQKPIKKVMMPTDLPFVFPTDVFLYSLFVLLIMLVIWFLVKGNHTSGQTCAIVAVGVVALGLAMVVVNPLLQIMAQRVYAAKGTLPMASFSTLHNAINMFTTPVLNLAVILHLLAMGGYWRNGENQKKEESTPADLTQIK